MKYLLDTNICIYVIKHHPESVIQKFTSQKIGDIGISTITLSELYYGVAKSNQIETNKRALEKFIMPLEVAPFNDLASECYGQLRADLEKTGNLIGPMDLMIAAHALSLNTILVTNNVREFNRVNKLKIENWVENSLN